MTKKKPLFRDSSETYQSDADLEFTSGESLTIPDDSFSISEILTRFRAGIIDGIQFPDDDEDTDSYDDVDIYRTDGADISDVYHELNRFAESEKKEEVRRGKNENPDITEAVMDGAGVSDAGTDPKAV